MSRGAVLPQFAEISSLRRGGVMMRMQVAAPNHLAEQMRVGGRNSHRQA